MWDLCKTILSRFSLMYLYPTTKKPRASSLCLYHSDCVSIVCVCVSKLTMINSTQLICTVVSEPYQCLSVHIGLGSLVSAPVKLVVLQAVPHYHEMVARATTY